MGLQPERGDVVRSVDPFKLGTNRQRPWLVVSTDRHPFADEQCIAVATSTTRYAESIPLPDGAWVVGGVPRESFASPWAVHSPPLRGSRGLAGAGDGDDGRGGPRPAGHGPAIRQLADLVGACHDYSRILTDRSPVGGRNAPLWCGRGAGSHVC